MRDYHRNYRVSQPQGFLEYDMIVRRLAAVAQAGSNPRPFDWAAECNTIFRQCFAGYSPGKCESCGSVRHYTDECKPGLLDKETETRRFGGYGEGGGADSIPGRRGTEVQVQVEAGAAAFGERESRRFVARRHQPTRRVQRMEQWRLLPAELPLQAQRVQDLRREPPLVGSVVPQVRGGRQDQAGSGPLRAAAC